ncbi:hypothetical protein AVEN_138246-1 [Araneus ventricosus]|uniref:Uncharacterized protein n=1 Tax=Araneus ventricosus TaxID=182803 RepID=A0A4Y2BVD4_ARAVE|nr:hypothetical protein AVEN_10959-1 [Araneus ventricosus]GBL96162.1 hypothetical protein AVEN_30249-1 [Araneus ventricosus]GBL96229.1 hypothetical protein AVEN_106034-1 [Araneus ventricosus]GBL96272.1 hypothetical protein AVEN_138246-1 [Araneus ventricosus]
MGRGGFMVISRLWAREFHPKSAVYGGRLCVKSSVWSQTTYRWCGAEFWRRGYQLRCCPRHLTGGSRLRDWSQNSSRDVSERDVNVTKLNYIQGEAPR